MTYSVMIFAPRKAGVTHEVFKNRYEQHMQMITELCGDAAPVSHTRWYLQHDERDEPVLLAGNAAEMVHDAVVVMSFEDEAGFERFCAVLDKGEAKAMVEADEAGFWDRGRMKVVAVGDVEVSRR